MAPLATLSIDLEGTAIGLRPPSQDTNQALPGPAEIFGRLYPKINLPRAVGESPSTRYIGRLAHEVAIEDYHRG